jgi:hypothetical protein
MKCLSGFALGLLSLAFLSTPFQSAKAAVGTLTIDGSDIDFTIDVSGFPSRNFAWVNSVTLSAPDSVWVNAISHRDNLTTGMGYTHALSNPPTSGTATGNLPFPTAGTYECYVIDSGTTGYFPMTPWYISTNHISVDIF